MTQVYANLLANAGLAVLLLLPSEAMAQSLGSAQSFAIIGGTSVTAAGTGSLITGDVGVSPGSSITGFDGTSATIVPPFSTYIPPAADAPQGSVGALYTFLEGAGPCSPLGPQLDGETVLPGVYCFSSTADLAATGTLTLDGAGLYIFQVGSALTANVQSTVSLINGADPCNVFWQVTSAATLNGVNFAGNVVAQAGVTIGTDASLAGRALTTIAGAVTIAGGNTVGGCSISPTPVPTATGAPTATAEPTAAPTAEPTGIPTAAPTAEPTPTPTIAPTAAPTAEPTAIPTAAPTAEPTPTPTIAPTAAPTAEPTATPTAEPTPTPTIAPTAEPTPTPTIVPTATPTIVPTAAPTPALGGVLEIDKLQPQLAIDADSSLSVTPGDTLQWTIEVSNGGGTALTNVTVSDDVADTLSCQRADTTSFDHLGGDALAVGETITCTATYVVTAADGVLGQVVNTATADSDETDEVEDTEMTVLEGGMGVLAPVCKHPCPARLVFRSTRGGARNDSFTMQGLVGLPVDFDPRAHGFTLRLSNANGIFYEGSLLPGDLKGRKNKAAFRDKSALKGPGIRDGLHSVKLQYRRQSDGWRVSVRAGADLSAATEPEMTVRLTIGGFIFETTNIWTSNRTSWKLQFNQ